MKTPSLLDSRKIVSLPVGAIKPNPHQPRRQFDPEELRELGESIRLYGICPGSSCSSCNSGSSGSYGSHGSPGSLLQVVPESAAEL